MYIPFHARLYSLIMHIQIQIKMQCRIHKKGVTDGRTRPTLLSCPHTYTKIRPLALKGLDKTPKQTLWLRIEVGDQCQHQGPAEFTGLTPLWSPRLSPVDHLRTIAPSYNHLFVFKPNVLQLIAFFRAANTFYPAFIIMLCNIFKC